ncbi:hypothetical protein [Sphingopyxis flava]|uniref:Uncharacterized protein n=1 Tax=Sphingopyxis flava TaxID=1507287 RepID=A0A1T5ADM8_9SPHN|nr:hypothetical protein [Sphingopyxis flava]SKB32783.1 hypothetical protein SAMN06295937_1003109 [Sphingopyxis flava]
MSQQTAFPDVKPFPEPRSGPAPMGDNRPPVDVQAGIDFDEALDAKLRAKGLTRAKFDELVASSERAQATNDETLGRCGDLVKQIRAATGMIGETHTEVKRPYLDAGRVVDDRKNSLIAPLDAAKRHVEGLQSKFLREREEARLAEERRRREEEEQRRREMTEARAAEAGEAPAEAEEPFEPLAVAAPKDEGIVRGSLGSAVSARREWVAEIVDYDVAYIQVASNAKVREAIEAAVKARVRAGERQIEGVKIYQAVKASNR